MEVTIEGLADLFKALDTIPAMAERALYLASQGAIAEYGDGLFGRGRKSDGSPIGEYKKEYKSKGKNKGKLKGWAGVRVENNRQVDYVDLKNEGELQTDFLNSLTKTADNTWWYGMKAPENQAKRGGMEKLYGADLFQLSPQAVTQLTADAEEELGESIRKAGLS